MRFKSKSLIERTFYSLLPMQIIMAIITSINSIVDGMIASNFVGVKALAVIALFLPVLRILDTINAIFLGGSQILCGRFIGKNQVKKSVSIFSTDVFFIFLVGLIVSVACVLFSKPICILLVADKELLQALIDYIRGYAPGIIPLLFISQLTAFLQMERQEKRSYFGMATMITLNLACDIVFVSIFNMGMFGLGLASTVSHTAFFLILVSYYFLHDSSLKFEFKGVDVSEIINIIHVGFPGAVNALSQAVRAAVLNLIMLTFVGDDGMAAFTAVYSFGAIFWAPSGGVSNAVRVLSSIYAGEEDREGLNSLLHISLTRGLAVVGMFQIGCILLAPVFTRFFYGPDAGIVYNMTLAGFILFPLTMSFSCICTTFGNYYQCLGHLKIVNILMLVDGVLGVILFSLLFAPSLGLTGIWLAHIASGILTVIVVFVYTIIKNRRLPNKLEDYLVFDENFGVDESNRIDINIANMNDVINLSEKVVDFSKQHGIDDRRSMIAGLCIEEMAGNIVLHGFDEKKDYSIDARIVYKDDGLLIRIKDNCKVFNPKEVQDIFDPVDITKNVGIRLASRMAKDMSYNNSLGINVLNISV